ncbi:MAG: hypothetical protein ABSF44_15930 [Candidatus Bathyarchaeia archaeon]|jgi:hypothetical protein
MKEGEERGRSSMQITGDTLNEKSNIGLTRIESHHIFGNPRVKKLIYWKYKVAQSVVLWGLIRNDRKS